MNKANVGRPSMPSVFAMMDLSGGVQNATSHLLRKRIEVFDSSNATYHQYIGSATRRDGYEQVGQAIQFGNDSLYGGVYLYQSTNNKVLVGANNSTGTNAVLSYLDSNNYWVPIISTALPDTRFSCLNYLDELYVCGSAPTGYMALTNVDYTLQPSTTRNVLNAPQCAMIAQYNGQLYAMDCVVDGVTYTDRIYISSSPLGAVTFVQTNQQGLLNGLLVDSVQYLKVGMSIDIYKAGTNQLEVQSLPIVSVDKAHQTIGFQPIQINVNENDEIWVSGRHGLLTTLWNTDYPTPQTADWIRVPPGMDEVAKYTAYVNDNNRIFFFTRNSTWKYDGQNLVNISPVIGALNSRLVQIVGNWIIFLHSTGVWGYNDSTGQLKILSRAIQNTIRMINPSEYPNLSSVVSKRIVKFSLGQLMSGTLETTSTSTSSTSTSSTSSSTSSTSTSSTSTSSTVTTTTSTSSSSTSVSSTSMSSTSSSTSTSSTSSSTSSTSSSSTSTSLSTSTSSTTTTTLNNGVAVTRACYDFDLNIWWLEKFNRHHRYQFIHTMNGYVKPYFTDENGYLFRDETGNTDFGLSIPMYVDLGTTNCGTEQNKAYLSLVVDSEYARGGTIQYALDGGDWQTLGEINKDIDVLSFKQTGGLNRSRNIDLRFSITKASDPPVFNGLQLQFNVIEGIMNEIGNTL